MTTIALITPSYGPDARRCHRLCASVDRFVSDFNEHVIIVPNRDRKLFSELESPRRRVLTVEEVLPRQYRRLPITERWWLDSRFFPVRGWIVQQLVKLASHHTTDAEVLCMVDSDVQFFRDFSVSRFMTGGQVRLQTVVRDDMPSPAHGVWQATAERLLGLPAEVFTRDYVGQLITWRSDHVAALLDHVAKVTGKPWHLAIGRELRFSEYILYGHFNDRVLGAASRHINECPPYCVELWDAEEVARLRSGEVRPEPGQYALLIQSALGLSDDEETALVQAVIAGIGSESGVSVNTGGFLATAQERSEHGQ